MILVILVHGHRLAGGECHFQQEPKMT